MTTYSNHFVADPELLTALTRRSKPTRITGDRVLFRQGDAVVGLYVLASGTATLTMRSAKGEVVLKTHVGAGSILGLPAVISNKPYTLTAEVLEASVVRLVDRDEFADMIRASPDLSFKVLQVLAAEVRSVRESLAG
jgi:CRP-like cAMP-binding protein